MAAPKARLRSVEGRDPAQVGAINQGLDAVPLGQDELPGVDLSGPTTPDPFAGQGFADEDEEFLFGPTSRPEEKLSTVNPRVRREPLPKDVERFMPDLVRAAEDPNAPAELHAYLRLINLHSER